jgi:hypothetical protein
MKEKATATAKHVRAKKQAAKRKHAELELCDHNDENMEDEDGDLSDDEDKDDSDDKMTKLRKMMITIGTKIK